MHVRSNASVFYIFFTRLFSKIKNAEIGEIAALKGDQSEIQRRRMFSRLWLHVS